MPESAIKCWERGTEVRYDNRKLASLLHLIMGLIEDGIRWARCKAFHNQAFHINQTAQAQNAFRNLRPPAA